MDSLEDKDSKKHSGGIFTLWKQQFWDDDQMDIRVDGVKRQTSGKKCMVHYFSTLVCKLIAGKFSAAKPKEPQ